MKTSQITAVLNGAESWTDLLAASSSEESRFARRLDGAATSGDFPLFFDAAGTVITKSHVVSLCEAVTERKVSRKSAAFLATALVLSAFEFDDEKTEECLHEMSTNSGGYLDGALWARTMLKYLL